MEKMKMMKSIRLVSVLCICAAVEACSTARPGADGFNAGHAASEASSFEITYSLGGHAQHRLSGFSTLAKTNPYLAAYLERSIIEERSIGPGTYDQYFSKVLDFARRTQRAPSQDSECRSPYSVIAKINGKTYSSKGCRGQKDDTAFGKLLREGEFLLYSKK